MQTQDAKTQDAEKRLPPATSTAFLFWRREQLEIATQTAFGSAFLLIVVNLRNPVSTRCNVHTCGDGFVFYKHRPSLLLAILSFRTASRILAFKQHGLVLKLRANKLTPIPPFSTLFSASLRTTRVKSPATEIHHGRVSCFSSLRDSRAWRQLRWTSKLIDLVTDSDLLFALSGIP